MRVLVCGGRHFGETNKEERKFIHRKLNKFCKQYESKEIVIIHGGATGADTVARKWAVKNWIQNIAFPVTPEEWNTLGRAAGPIRNRKMLKEGKPDIVLAFPGGTGTADMIRAAKEAAVKVKQFVYGEGK